ELHRRPQQVSLSRRPTQRHMIIIPERSAPPSHRHAKNTSHLDAYWNGHALDRTRTSHLARLDLALAAQSN
ncbi:MAG: hypothetical protein ACRDQU_21565, partial [Pseudonocardiaceae bacterium]